MYNQLVSAPSSSSVHLRFDETVVTVPSAKAHRSAMIVSCAPNSKLAAWLAPYVGAGMLDEISIANVANDTPNQISAVADSSHVCVEDLKDAGVQFGLGEDIVWRKDPDNTSPSIGAGNILLLKICGALAAQYNPQTVASVGQLVKSNTVTAVYGDIVGDEDAAVAVAYLLDGLLDSSQARTRSVKVNTNEPVLLVNNHNLPRLVFNSVVTETIQQLQRHWNIWPVRIYAGTFSHDDTTGFSVSLLNVVNTDIGGPSMIQLLDAPCEAPGWLGFVRREVWNGQELLDRDEKGIDIQLELQATSTDTDQPEDGDEDGDVVAQLTREVATIQHPTWTHSSRSLLDMIKDQALKVGEKEDETTGAKKAIEPTSGSEVDFVVVS